MCKSIFKKFPSVYIIKVFMKKIENLSLILGKLK